MSCIALAAFDLDNTLVKGNSSFQFGKHLYKHRQIPFFTMVQLVGNYFFYKTGVLTIPEMQNAIFQKFFLGKNSSLIQERACEFVEEHFDSILYQPALQRLKESQQAGHHTVILSSSPSFIVEPFAKRLNVNAWAATRYQVENGSFSGISQFMLSDDKADYVIHLAEQLKISKQQIIVYSDSHEDCSFLSVAGQPVAVNPSRALRKICKHNNWTVLQ